MKKILSLLVALLFTFSLVACQNNTTMKTDIDTIIVNNIAEEITFDSFVNIIVTYNIMPNFLSRFVKKH